MNKDEIKKALECCSENTMNNCKNCPYYYIFNCNDTLCKDALNLITEQDKEIERLTEKLKQVLLAVDTVKEMTAMCNIDKQNAEIERLKDDYAKLQELFAKYQIASDKEIIAQKKQAEKRFENNMKAVLEIEKKQAVKEFAENLKTRFEEKEQHYICMYDWDGHSAVVDCANEVDELLKEYSE